MDIVALSNGLYGSISVDWVAPPPWNIQCQYHLVVRNCPFDYFEYAKEVTGWNLANK